MPPFNVTDGVYLSDGSDARRYGNEFEQVVTLSRDSGVEAALDDEFGPHEWTTTHVPLRDGQNEQAQFDRAVEATIEAIGADGDTLVHCQAGMSRSPTVLMAALARIEDIPFDEAYNMVYNAKPSIAPHPELRKLALEHLDEDGSVYKDPF